MGYIITVPAKFISLKCVREYTRTMRCIVMPTSAEGEGTYCHKATV